MKAILPGATLGILGGGQLGRMFALSARKLGYRVHAYEPSPDSPTGQISDLEVNRPYEDTAALTEFARGVDVITYEFENIPAATLDLLSPLVPLRPGREVLYIAQSRRREKEFLSANGFPVVPHRIVSSLEEFRAAVGELGRPSVLKTVDFGYDGKGQQAIREGGEDLAVLWQKHGAPSGIVEAWIECQAELSVLVARGGEGEVRTFPVSRNDHRHHILDLSVVPSGLPEEVEEKARRVAIAIAEKLELVGLLAVEFFLVQKGEVLVNEMAPRPHNSGHYSFDACVTSQFEQQLRAVCGLPLGETTLLSPVVMRNLLGDVWAKGTPPWEQLLALPGLRLHLYGKTDPRPGRKMGHYCVLAPTVAEALAIDARAQALLRR